MRYLITASLIVLPYAASAQDDDQGYLTTLLEDNLAGDDRVVDIIGFEGALSSEATIRQLTVADSEGVWLTLDDVVLQWNRRALLRGAIDVETLGAAQITVARAPVSAAEPPAAEATPFALPELPVSIRLGSLAVDRIALGPDFLGEDVAFEINGSAALADGEGVVDIAATRLDGPTGRFAVAGSYANATQALSLALDLTEAPEGIAAHQIGLPGLPSVDLQLDGDGLLSDFTATLALDTDGAERLAGQMTLRDEDGRATFDLNIGGDIAPLFAPQYQDFFGTDLQLVATGRQTTDGGFSLSNLDLGAQKLRLTGSADIAPGGWPARLDLTGDIADDAGNTVLLPLSGPETFVDRVDLDIGYDRAVSDNWNAAFTIAGLDRPGLYIDDLTLEGGGLLSEGAGAVTALLTYAATGVELDTTGADEALGDTISGVLDLDYTVGAPTRLNRLTLTGPGIDLRAEATVDTPDNNLATTATASLTAESLSRFATLIGQPGLGGAAELTIRSTIDPAAADYNVMVTGATTDLTTGIAQLDPLLDGRGAISVQARRDTSGTVLDQFRIATDQALVTANARIADAGGSADFDVNVTDVALIEPSLTGPARIAGTADIDAGGQIAFDVAATLDAGEITATGTAQPSEAALPIISTITVNSPQLAAFQGLTGQPLRGGVDIQLDSQFYREDTRISGRLTGATANLVTGIAQLDPLLAGAGAIATTFSGSAAGDFDIADLNLTTPALTLTADAQGSTDGPITAEAQATLNDAGALASGLSGPVELDLTAGRSESAQISVDLSLQGSGADVQLQATADQMGDLYGVAGTLDADVADLAPFAPLAGRPIAGAVSADVTGSLMSDLSSFAADLTIGTRDLSIGDARVDPVLAGTGAITGTVARTAQGDVAVDLDGQIGGTTLTTRATGTPAGDALALTGTLSAGVDDLRPFAALAGQPLSGAVSADINGSVTTDLSAFDGTIAVRSTSPAIGNPSVDQLLRGPGSVTVTATRVAGGISVPRFSADFSQINASGSANLSDAGTGRAEFEARLADVGLFTDQLSGPVTASGQASRGTGNWGLNINANGPGGINAVAAGTVADSGTLNIDLTGGAPLGLANTILAPRRIDGDLRFDLAINGPAALNSVSGRISTAGAQLSAPTLALSLQDLTGGVTLSQGVAQIGLTAAVPTGGTLSVDGPVTLSAPFNGDLGVVLNGVVLTDPTLYRTSVDGRVGVTGPLTGGARIGGTLTLGQTDVQVPSSGIGAFGDLPDVTHVGASPATRLTLDRAGVDENADASGGGSTAAFPLDLTINAPSRIFIRGRGLDAELGGALSIGGTTANIVPTGQFSLVRGRLNILQQRFDLTEGVATLQGDFIPTLRLEAETETRTGTLVRIIVSGPAASPEVTFSSVPELPQDEVLAQLIFGRNLSEISPLQAVQLASAVGTLAGRGGGGIIDNFRNNLGLDDFDVTTDDDGNAAVRAGAYLSENVYTDVTINAEGETEINLNLDITSEITAKGTANADGETSIGIFFERDY